MKHKTVDLETQIRRESLPKGVEGFLFPVFEAVSNALHSIDDRFGDGLQEDGHISIKFNSDNKTIEVCDNGDGFNKNNLNAFLTPFTGNKIKRKGKGFGRFISFKVFEEVYYASPTVLPDKIDFIQSVFQYTPFVEDDNLVLLNDQNIFRVHPYSRGLSVSFRTPKEEYEQYFIFRSKDKSDGYSEEDLVIAMLDHFLLDFIQEKTPKNFIFDINGAPFNLSAYFNESVKRVATSDKRIDFEGKSHLFSFEYMQLDATKSKGHNLYFYADNRATSDLENISKGLNNKAFQDENGKEYYYLVAVSSDFFKTSQSRDRIQNLNLKIDTENGRRSLKDILANIAKAKILELEPNYTKKRRKAMYEQVEKILVFDPILRRGLGTKTIDEFVLDRSITETKEQIASDLFIMRNRSKFDFNIINSTTPIEELQKLVRDSVSADAKEALAVYVAHRNNVLKVLREMLQRHDGKGTDEDRVHELIYPRYKDSEQIQYASHNLWLIDDDLAYAEYVSSDRTTKGARRSTGDFAHDLLVNSQKELLIVEMKRPHKANYDSEPNARQKTNNPIQQLINQVDQIRENGYILTSGKRRMEISSKHMVRAYILADWNESLEKYIRTNDYVSTDFGGPMAYRYYRELNMIIEVLAFDRLVDRASKRNEIFTKILGGESDYQGKQKSNL